MPFDKAGADLLFGFISQRYERRSLVVTTNLPFARWSEVFLDATAAAAPVAGSGAGVRRLRLGAWGDGTIHRLPGPLASLTRSCTPFDSIANPHTNQFFVPLCSVLFRIFSPNRPSKPGVAGSSPAGRATFLDNSPIVPTFATPRRMCGEHSDRSGSKIG